MLAAGGAPVVGVPVEFAELGEPLVPEGLVDDDDDGAPEEIAEERAELTDAAGSAEATALEMALAALLGALLATEMTVAAP